MGETSFQFQCPSCSAVLQATLTKELTSVQCGECYDVFDVQHPGRCAPSRKCAWWLPPRTNFDPAAQQPRAAPPFQKCRNGSAPP